MTVVPPVTGIQSSASPVVRALLANAIDYAGLFPPENLPLAVATEHYLFCSQGPHAYALGRMVLPLMRLPEFETELKRCATPTGYTWRLSVLAGPDPSADAVVIQEFNRRQSVARIVSVETKAANPAEVAARTAALPGTIQVWVEVPVSGDVAVMVSAIRHAGRSAKIRMGGVTADAFPSATDVVRFLVACHQARVTAKATAGLHHPLCGNYPFTYEGDSPTGSMFGFVNVFLAAALIQSGGTREQAILLLTDADPGNFAVLADAITWRGFRFTISHLTFMRDTLCRSFGSCSFTEPITGLTWL
jgi:hypothetical protein